VRRLYDFCRAEKYRDARPLQEDASSLFRMFRETGVPGLKAASRLMGRDCGDPRPPLPSLTDAKAESLLREWSAEKPIEAEPRGWA
jgi:dihydrodipicolinate synthase/N-acetylneuraminate lyase